MKMSIKTRMRITKERNTGIKTKVGTGTRTKWEREWEQEGK